MSKLVAEYLQHPLSASANIALLDDGSVGGVLGATLGSKLDTSAYQPGLVLITSQTFSTVSSVSVNNCFSATYQNYLLNIEAITVNTVDIFVRLRVSGSDASGTDYDAGEVRLFTGSTAVTNSVNTTSIKILTSGSVQAGGWVNIYRPFEAARTILTGTYTTEQSSAIRLGNTGGYHKLTNSYDGITMFPDTGTITGKFRIYGYRN